MGQSRNEDILESIIDGTEYTAPPQSRIEDLLLELKETIEKQEKPIHEYSTTEQVVGTWINGKPVYEKTLDCGRMPNNTTKFVDIAENVDTVVSMFGYARFNTGEYGRPLPYVYDRKNSTEHDYTCKLDFDNDRVRITTFDYWDFNAQGGYDGVIIVRYTKTTDQPTA